MALNPISAPTRATLVQMVRDLTVNDPVRNIMIEVEAVANKFGVGVVASIDQRIADADARTKLLDAISRGGLK